MYFRNYGRRNTWLIKSVKSPLSEDTSGSNTKGRPNTFEIWTTPPLPYLLTTLKPIEFEKYLLVIYKVLRIFVNILTAADKDSLLNRNNLR